MSKGGNGSVREWNSVLPGKEDFYLVPIDLCYQLHSIPCLRGNDHDPTAEMLETHWILMGDQRRRQDGSIRWNSSSVKQTASFLTSLAIWQCYILNNSNTFVGAVLSTALPHTPIFLWLPYIRNNKPVATKSLKSWVYCICNKNEHDLLGPAYYTITVYSSWFHNHIK